MSRTKFAFIAAAAAGISAAALALPTAPASAAKPAPPPSPTATPTPVIYTETGCYDILGGGPDYQKLLQSITTLTPPTAGVPGTYTMLQLAEEGLLETKVILAAPSCSDATYQMEAFDAAGTSLGKTNARGNGTDSVALDLVIRDQTALNVFVQVRSIAPTGQIVDRGADGTGTDGSVEVVADADGTPADDSGGNVTWR